MAHYKTLPTTNIEVAELFYDLGYTDELVQEKYGLNRDVMKALSGEHAYFNNNFHITFHPGGDQKENDAWKEWADKKPESFILFFANVHLTFFIKGKHVYHQRGWDVMTSTFIPFAITADTKPDELFEKLFQKIEDFSNSVQVSVVKQ